MKDKLLKYYKIIVSACVLLSVVVLFFNCGAYIINGEKITVVNGFHMIFGKTDEGYKFLKFNGVGAILLLLMIWSMIMPHLENSVGKFTDIICAVLLVLSGVVYLLLPSTTVHSSSFVENNFYGLPMLYVGAIIMFVGAIFSAFMFCLKLRIKNNKAVK